MGMCLKCCVECLYAQGIEIYMLDLLEFQDTQIFVYVFDGSSGFAHKSDQ